MRGPFPDVQLVIAAVALCIIQSGVALVEEPPTTTHGRDDLFMLQPPLLYAQKAIRVRFPGS